MEKPKQWKAGGELDKFITKLIKKGKVHKKTKPSSLKVEYPSLFGEISPNIIRNHLNILKRTNGLYLDGQSDEDDEVYDFTQEMKEDENDLHVDVPMDFGCVTNVHQNYPVLCETFKEPENQSEKVVMAVLLPSGAQNSKIELSDDGMIAYIKYVWPKTMFNMHDLFKKHLLTRQVDVHHPKILCLQSGLERVRKRVDVAPEALIKVNLPIKVQTATDSWTHSGVKREDGSNVVFAEFKGYVKEYNKKANDSLIVFDM